MLTDPLEIGMKSKRPKTLAFRFASAAFLSATLPFAIAQENPAPAPKALTAPPAPANNADPAALAILDAGRRLYNEGKFPEAAERFREFLKANSQKAEAPSAHYGLALALLEVPQKDAATTAAIAEALQQVIGKPNAAERPFALYYFATTQRTVGLQILEQAAAKPMEAVNLRSKAATHFAEAAKTFAQAGDAFEPLAKAKPAAEGDTSNLDWYLRSRADQCDMLLQSEKPKDVLALAPKLTADKDFAKSPFRSLLLYQTGCAHFGLKEYRLAGRALSKLAPFDQACGIHARYLLSRVHHLADEFPEAAAGYKALVADYEQQKKIAAEAMKNPAAWKPDERARFENLLKPAPDYIARATFYYAQLQAEAGEFGEALNVFNAFVQQFPTSPLLDEAKLRQGYCFLQAKNYAETQKVLQPLLAHAQLADRALWWYGRSQLAVGDPANAPAMEQAAKSAIDSLQKAAEKAGALGQTDPEAKTRRGEILLDLGAAQQAAQQIKESAATYAKVAAEYGTSRLAEEALQRQVTALHLGGLYKESDELAQKFELKYPKSMLLDIVWFRSAENAYLSAMAASADPKANENRAAWEKTFDESIARYKRLLQKYPEFTYMNLARYGLGTAQYRRGLHADAFDTLTTILDADRSGELSQVNYLLADALLRRLPPETNDALQAAQLLDRADQAARFLEKYAAAQGKTPQGADALLKLGHCYQRMGALIIDPLERTKLLAQSRQAYEKVLNELGNTPAMPAAVLERAGCIALQGDINGAINEFNRFNGDPLKQTPLAPLALIRLSTLMQSQNRHGDAVNVMVECRKRYEESLKKDAIRAAWVPQIQYEHGLAQKSSGKIADARAIFEAVAKEFDKSPEATSAIWRAAQCRREELQAAIAAAYTALKKPGLKPEETVEPLKVIEQSLTALRQTAESLKSEVAKQSSSSASEIQVRMLYEAAWCYRALADAEIESVRRAAAAKVLGKAADNWKKAAPNQPAPALLTVEIPLKDIPPQPSEKAAQDQYRTILTLAPASLQASRIRLELAELLERREQHDAALELLATALEDNPPRDLSERLHLRLATCLLAKDEAKPALLQAQAVTKNTASPNMGEALFLIAESHLVSKDWNNAIATFANFRDKDPFRNMNTLTERGLYRLSFAFAQAQRMDESRQALEQIVQRFPQSPFVADARMQMAAMWEKANQLDNAYNNYAEVARKFAGDLAARAQFQMGRIRQTQKRPAEAAKDFLLVANLHDVPDLSAEALVEAGQAQLEQKQNPEAKATFERVLKDYPASKSVETAKKRLAEIK